MPRLLTWLRTAIKFLKPDRISPLAPPQTFRDNRAREIHIRPYEPTDFECLADMYDGFEPSERAQGTPPIDRESIIRWVHDTMTAGPNVVALHGNRIVGHVSFVPDDTGRHELAIFVHQDYQRAGIGSELLGVGMGHAKREGVGYVWLSVEAWKRGIQRLYRKAGFSVVNAMGTAHRMSRTL